jgi:hypothetical protein
MMRIRLAALGTTAALAAAAPAVGAPTPPQFKPEVVLTKPNLGGFEPGVQVDRFGNVFVTAHKQRHINVVAPDDESPTGVRLASFIWTSTDGQHFHSLTPDPKYEMNFGDEGDIALDDADHLYFVDTNVTDVSFARWKIGGLGEQTLESARPVLPAGQLVDDRPWIAAHHDGTVLYMANTGDGAAYPIGDESAGDGTGLGRFSVYMSYDRGETFDVRGKTLKDSGWCRPAADHRPGSKTFYVVCSNNDLGLPVSDTSLVTDLRAYVSHDDGATWTVHRIAHYTAAGWPSIAVDGTGVVHALVQDTQTIDGKSVDVLRVFDSRDGGVTWKEQDVPWTGGSIAMSWLDAARDGTVGVGFYAQQNADTDWQVYAAVRPPTGGWGIGQVSQTAIAPASSFPKGDFFQVAFGPDDRLSVAWTRFATLGPTPSGNTNTDVVFAQQR